VPSYRIAAVASSAILVMVLSFSAAPSVWAKGSVLETEKQGYHSGHMAVAQATFSSGYYDGTVADGPYHAYLVPYTKPLEPGRIPTYAVPLGEIRITPTGTRVWTAVIEFEVPKVAAGLYRLDYCNVPCTVSGLEELEAGSFAVLKTIQEGRFDKIQGAIDSMRQEVRNLDDSLEASKETEGQLAADNKKLRAEMEDSSRLRLPLIEVVIAGLAAVGALVFSFRNHMLRGRLAHLAFFHRSLTDGTARR
jgi:primosomal replication protein N